MVTMGVTVLQRGYCIVTAELPRRGYEGEQKGSKRSVGVCV